ncbi:MAG: hypothetical protein Q7U54_05130 [Bacteroidales bacterium]|nr:hypothetical protein [Bacteroidales bacterium]
MKTFKLIVLAMGLFIAGSSQAQVSVNINLGSPPMWGPAGYADVQYYYLPDVYAYYDIHSSMFIYQSGGVWVHRTYLPSRYRNYDLYGGYKVVMHDYHGTRPYSHYNDYKRKYARGYHGPAQRNIGVRPEHGYSGTRGDMNGRPNKAINRGNARPTGHGNVKSSGHGNVKSSGHDNNKQKKSNGKEKRNGKGNGRK